MYDWEYFWLTIKVNKKGIMEISNKHKLEKILIVLLIISLKNSFLSLSLIWSDADSVHDSPNIEKNPFIILGNLQDTVYIPLEAIPRKMDIIVLSDTFTIHHDIPFGINGIEYLSIFFLKEDVTLFSDINFIRFIDINK